MDAMARPRTRVRFPAVNVALFLATVATTLWAGFLRSPLAAAPSVANFFVGGLPFAGSLVAILFTHEMGHYVLARRYGVSTTLPYFIPLPFGGVGTLGAVIRMRSALPSRRATLDIGAAGPIAGFAVALPLLVWGLAHSEVQAIASAHAVSINSPFDVLRAVVQGRPLTGGDGSMEFFGDSALTWAVARIVHGTLAPGHDVVLHPVAFAAWIGLLVTTLNLVPVGQLDGGHVLYALLGRRGAERASRAVSRGLLLAGIFLSWNWLVWWLLTRTVIGVRHPPALAEEPLGRGRKVVAVLSLVLFAATFIPVPVSL